MKQRKPKPKTGRWKECKECKNPIWVVPCLENKRLFCSKKCCDKNKKGQFYGKRKSIVKNCLKCGKKFLVYPYRKNTADFCSNKCRRTRIIKMCIVCGTDFFTYACLSPIKQNKYCSRKCYDKNRDMGKTSIQKRIRESFEYEEWRKAVFERDLYTCQICFEVGGKLNADHIKRFADFPELRLEISNGRTLCESCHRKTDTYGNRKNCEAQIEKAKNFIDTLGPEIVSYFNQNNIVKTT